ncbi:hypothetical protein [Enterococcus faecium]|nr:hypothetical protein [Enterococcus faecium]EGP5557233.1 hypothetical protein [Enterococcus faecium]EKZ0101998.1 hypothetical protein [Enterococcus faecium]MBE9892677.1 hypothetical protein [Enterococcus faecium]
MKKITLLGFVFAGSLILGACGSTSGTADSEAQKTIDSLKAENSDMSKTIESYQTLLGTEESESTVETTDTTSSSEQKYSMGQVLDLGKDDKKNAEIKIVEVTTNQSAFPDHMISMDSYDTTKMIAVKIEYTNVALEENFLPYAQYFQAFSDDGKSLTQVNQQNGQEAVGIGRTGTTQLFWELPVDGNQFNHVEIDFVPSTTKVATFSLDVSH